MSLSQLYKQGHNVHFDLDFWKLSKGQLILAKGKKFGSLYILECNDEVGETMVVVDSNVEFWHKRIGHMSKTGLKVMLQRDQILGLKLIDLELCEHFFFRK